MASNLLAMAPKQANSPFQIIPPVFRPSLRATHPARPVRGCGAGRACVQRLARGGATSFEVTGTQRGPFPSTRNGLRPARPEVPDGEFLLRDLWGCFGEVSSGWSSCDEVESSRNMLELLGHLRPFDL